MPSVWHQFSGSSDATFFNGNQSFELNDERSNRTYGEISAMVNIFRRPSDQASGFIKADYRFGEDMSGFGIRFGYRAGF